MVVIYLVIASKCLLCWSYRTSKLNVVTPYSLQIFENKNMIMTNTVGDEGHNYVAIHFNKTDTPILLKCSLSVLLICIATYL